MVPANTLVPHVNTPLTLVHVIILIHTIMKLTASHDIRVHVFCLVQTLIESLLLEVPIISSSAYTLIPLPYTGNLDHTILR